MVFGYKLENEEQDRKAAERGAALLDRVQPDWFRHVDTEKLFLRECTKCVLGQLGGYDTFWNYLEHFLPRDEKNLGDVGFVCQNEYGFDLPFSARESAHPKVREARWVRLTNTWRDLIAARLKAQSTEDTDGPVAASYLPLAGKRGSVFARSRRAERQSVPRSEELALAEGH